MSRHNKNPENKVRFGGVNQHRDQMVLSFTFFYPDYTVGSGITPDHARFLRYPFPKKEIVTAQRGSWALPPIGNCTLPRRLLSCVVIIAQEA